MDVNNERWVNPEPGRLNNKVIPLLSFTNNLDSNDVTLVNNKAINLIMSGDSAECNISTLARKKGLSINPGIKTTNSRKNNFQQKRK